MAGFYAKNTVFSATIDSVLTPISSLTGITGLELSADDVDVSAHDSTDNFREYVQGMRDGGEVTLEGNYVSDNAQYGLYSLFQAGTVVAMTIEFPDNLGSWSFNGYVKGVSNDAPYDEKLAFSATIKVTGKPTLTQGATSI
jgi:predicted secreted protein